MPDRLRAVAHEPSLACLPAGLAGRSRAALAVKLESEVLAALAGHRWVPYADLRVLAPEARVIVLTELDETPFGSDDPRGAAYDAGPSGEPDGGMLADVLGHLDGELLLTEDGFLQSGRVIRLYDPDEPAGLQEISERLRVKRATADQWRQRGVLPQPEPGTVGGRPWWRWGTIRDWAVETGRTQAARVIMRLVAVPVPSPPPGGMPEPLPEGAPWASVRNLTSFAGDGLRQWAEARIADGHLVFAAMDGSSTGRMYGQPPYMSVRVADSAEVLVSGTDAQAVRRSIVRGWGPLAEHSGLRPS